MKNTPLTNTHIALGAKMAEFAGYNMPISYKGIKEEHLQVRNAVGMFDVSHMGEFILEGENALDLIQKVTSNDASKLVDGQAQYSCLPNDKGGIVDDLLVYKIADDKYMLVVNASNINKDWNWITSHNDMGVKMTNISDDTSLLAVQGPKAVGDFAGCKDVILSATGYTGAGGFELYIPNESAVTVWNKIIEAGQEFGIQPIGLGARDTLRLEMGFCLYGNDIDDTTNPIEAGLGWITKFTKSFIGDQYAKDLKENGAKKKLVGIQMIDRGIPRHGYEITDASGNKIGIVTSGSQTPSLNVSIGIAYIDVPNNKLDTEVFVKIREQLVKAKVVKMPFYQKTS